MKTKVHWIPGGFPGRIGLMPHPRGHDWLEDEVRWLSDASVCVLVSLLEPAEATELGLDAEESICDRKRIQFISFPIPDRGIPLSRSDTVALVSGLAAALTSGRNIVVHCRQGIGRSALLAAAVLISLGVSRDDVFKIIGEARGCPVPDTQQQIDYALTFPSVPT